MKLATYHTCVSPVDPLLQLNSLISSIIKRTHLSLRPAAVNQAQNYLLTYCALIDKMRTEELTTAFRIKRRLLLSN